MASEERLIYANALKESVMKAIRHYWNEGEGGYYLAEDVIPDIDLAPTVDAVEVVRCKDCKYRCNGKDCDHPLLSSWSWGAIRNVKDDDFCSYGERKDNEQT